MRNRSLAYIAAALAVALSAVGARAQTAPLQPGSLLAPAVLYNDGSQPPGTCPTDFWSPPSPGTPPVCYQATMTCANTIATTPNLFFVYSYLLPQSTLKGTIILFSGTGGEPGSLAAVNNKFAKDYYNDGFEIVEVAWQTDWEQTASDPLGILTAACRPAGFLNYVLNTPLLNARSVNQFNGLCAQGISAGSGALAYSLAWYADGNKNYLNTDYDNVELESGPVFGDIGMGCQAGAAGSNPPIVPICYPGQQYGCSPATTGWGNFANYRRQLSLDPDLDRQPFPGVRCVKQLRQRPEVEGDEHRYRVGRKLRLS
jgi:hypothetical protein